MRRPSHSVKAGKQTVSLTINSDLYAQVKKLGINASQIAEQALSDEVARRRSEELRAEIAQDLEAISAYEAKHGSFAEMARAHYESRDED